MDKEINLFYDVKNLFNTSGEAFELYYIINSRLNKFREKERNILLVFPTREIKNRNMRHILARTQFKKINENIYVDLLNHTYYEFSSIIELKETKHIDGKRFTEIRFLG